jgi:hypothetical protein
MWLPVKSVFFLNDFVLFSLSPPSSTSGLNPLFADKKVYFPRGLDIPCGFLIS